MFPARSGICQYIGKSGGHDTVQRNSDRHHDKDNQPSHCPDLYDLSSIIIVRIRHPRRGGSPRAFRAWPSAWPSPSGPQGRQRSPALKGGSRRSFLRSGQKRSWGALDAGGADPDNARRSSLVAGNSLGDRRTCARMTAWPLLAGAEAGGTAGPAGGRSPGSRARLPPRP